MSFYRPTGLLAPDPAALAYASVELAALEYQARRGEILLLYADETILWRFALPRAGWWHRHAQRYRLPTRPLTQSQIKREEALKREAWRRYRSWSRITSGVLLNVLGAVQKLPMQIAKINIVKIDQPDLADASSGQIHGNGRTQASRADAQDGGGTNFLLPGQSDFRQNQVS